MPPIALPGYLLDHLDQAVSCGTTWTSTSHGTDAYAVRVESARRPAGTTRSLRDDPLVQAFYADARVQDGRVTRRDVTEMLLGPSAAVGVVAAMIWGGIKPSDLARLVRMGAAAIETRVEQVREGLAVESASEGSDREQAIRTAFRLLGAGGSAKLDGLGVAFYTKVLFFLGDRIFASGVRPLIFDQHTRRAHYVLLRQVDAAAAAVTYSSMLDTTGAPLARQTANGADAYVRYCSDLHAWTEEVRRQTGSAGFSPSALEAFLFGYSTHPRFRPSELCGGINPRQDFRERLAALRPGPALRGSV